MKWCDQAMKKHDEQSLHLFWPIVRFDNGITRTIYAYCEVNELGKSDPKTLVSRTQIPLTLGYAITAHKAQGMTLDKVRTNLKHAFTPGMPYVILSRVRRLEGIEVPGCRRTMIPCGRRILMFNGSWTRRHGRAYDARITVASGWLVTKVGGGDTVRFWIGALKACTSIYTLALSSDGKASREVYKARRLSPDVSPI